MSNLVKMVGERIREIRISKGWTQEELGEKAHLQYSYIGGVERGSRNISLSTLEKIMDALEVSPNEMFQFKNITIEKKEKKEVIKILESLLMERKPEEVRMIHTVTKEILSTFDTL